MIFFVIKIIFVIFILDIACQALFGNSITKSIKQVIDKKKYAELEHKLILLELAEAKEDEKLKLVDKIEKE